MAVSARGGAALVALCLVLVAGASWWYAALPGPAGGPPGSAGSDEAVVFKSASCGCCKSWVDRMREETSYRVDARDVADPAVAKEQFGVPDELWSCHTTVIDGKVFEGHVPPGDIVAFMQSVREGRNRSLRGLAVPGMPAGAPGMEHPDGHTDPWQVLTFDREGNTGIHDSSMATGGDPDTGRPSR